MKYYGQAALTEVSNGAVDGKHALHASGVVVDKSSTPNKLYVVDTGNNRILGYNGIGYCGGNTSLSCTVNSDCNPGVSCVIDGSKPADIVIGQANMNSGSCNGDSLKGMTGLPSASTLCLTAFPYGTNAAEQWGRVNIDVDSSGNLYVPDIYNNRVLKYNTPFSSDTVADYVWGQSDFISNNPNMSVYRTILGTPTASSLWLSGYPTNQVGMPTSAAWGVSVDAAGTVWVADTFNGRVLSFIQNQKAATNVVGKAN